MQRTTPILAALLVAALAGSANGASTFVIRGAGFGHGVGMSQYGADGYAQHGKDYRFILAHYYTGTALTTLSSSPTVRVLLQTQSSSSFTGASLASGRKLDPNQTYTVAPSGLNGVALRSASGRALKTFDPPLRVTSAGTIKLLGSAANGLSNGRYRGALEFKPNAVGSLETINALNLESYVAGVVGAESPPSWPAAALQAQAVAARTYAITTAVGGDFDQYADTRSQMYRGTAAETSSTQSAVQSTDGQVVTYQGKPVVTYFFSTSGGRTENVENSFIGSPPKPWLKSVPDPYDGVSPLHRWGPYKMSLSKAAGKLSGLVKGTFKGIDVTQRGKSPRVVYADVVGSSGRTRVTGPQLRARFGLDDTWATYNVISASGQTSNPPSSGGGGSGDDGSTNPSGDPETGGTGAPQGRMAHAALMRPRGVVHGHVGIVHRRQRVALQKQFGQQWRTVRQVHTDRGGAYRFRALRPGVYRVVWRGDAGPVVTL